MTDPFERPALAAQEATVRDIADQVAGNSDRDALLAYMDEYERRGLIIQRVTEAMSDVTESH